MNKVYRLWGMVNMLIISIGLFMVGCDSVSNEGETAVSPSTQTSNNTLTLSNLSAAKLDGDLLHVVATTSIIGDVVAQVGGEKIALTTLIGAGQEPHSYEAGARELTAVANAHVIFINGWDLEEGLVGDLTNIGEAVPIIPISANIEPLSLDGSTHADPHVWFSIPNVKQWVNNVEQTLSDLDPANADAYKNNAAAYLIDLNALEADVIATLATIPEEKRLLVTNHDSFSYFAHAYGFEIVGTVISGSSTLAEPSASSMVALIETMEAHRICVLFGETAVSSTLAQTITAELKGCEKVELLTLYTGTLGQSGSGADNYISMFRTNINTIITGLADNQ